MLVLSRKKNEAIIIDGQIEIKVIEIKGDTVRIGVVAPKHVKVHRQEIFEAIKMENETARASLTSLDALKLLKDSSKVRDSEENKDNTR